MNETSSNDYPPSWAAPNCAGHPEVEAAYSCPGCQAQFCEECVNLRRVGNQTVVFCRQCGGRCEAVSVASSGLESETRSQATGMAGAFSYPLRGDGPVILLAGTIFLGLLHLAAAIPIVGLVFALIGAGTLAAYLFSIVAESAKGSDTIPTWPDFTDFSHDILRPLLLVTATGLFCFGPAALYRIFGSAGGGVEWPYWVLFVLGSGCFPMALLAVVLADGVSGLNPMLIVRSIFRVPGPYLVTCVILGLLVLSGEGGLWLAESVPVIGGFIAGFFSLYISVVEMRLIGRMYYTHQEKLGWV